MRTQLTLSIIAAAALAAASAYAADAGRVSAAFGNTVETVHSDGRSQKIWMQPDGSWEGKSRTGNDLAGTWTLKDDKVCVKQSKPALPVGFCMTFPDDPHVGSTWPTKAFGENLTVKIVKGKVTG